MPFLAAMLGQGRAPASPDERRHADVHAGVSDGGDVRRPARHPRFHYHDKRRRTDIHFPRAGHAAFVEAARSRAARASFSGGSVYGCVFTGGAENDLFSFARLTRPSGPGLVRVLSGFVRGRPGSRPRAWCSDRQASSSGRSWPRRLAHPSGASRVAMVQEEDRRVGVDAPVVHVRGRPRSSTTACRRSTSTTSTTTRRPTRSVPRSRQAFAGSSAVDRSLRQIRRALRARARAPLRPLCPLGSRPGVLSTPYSRDDRRPAVRACCSSTRSSRMLCAASTGVRLAASARPGPAPRMPRPQAAGGRTAGPCR